MAVFVQLTLYVFQGKAVWVPSDDERLGFEPGVVCATHKKLSTVRTPHGDVSSRLALSLSVGFATVSCTALAFTRRCADTAV